MSSGIRDAANLSWKLALVLRGHAAERILGSYERERRPHVQKMTRLALTIGRVLQTQNRPAAAVRDTGFRLFGRLPGSGFVTGGGFKPDPRLPGGGLVADQRRRRGGGKLFIQPRVSAGGETLLLDEALGHGFAVIGMGQDPRWLAKTAPELWEALETRFIRVVAPGQERGSDPETVVDVDGAFAGWFRRRRADTVVLRPDRFVFGLYRVGDDDADAAAQDLRRVLGLDALEPAPDLAEAGT